MSCRHLRKEPRATLHQAKGFAEGASFENQSWGTRRRRRARKGQQAERLALQKAKAPSRERARVLHADSARDKRLLRLARRGGEEAQEAERGAATGERKRSGATSGGESESARKDGEDESPPKRRRPLGPTRARREKRRQGVEGAASLPSSSQRGSSQQAEDVDFHSGNEDSKGGRESDDEEKMDGEGDDLRVDFDERCSPKGERCDDGAPRHASASADVDSVVAFSSKGDGILRALPEDATYSMRALLARTHKANSSRVLVKLSHDDSSLPKRRGVIPGSDFNVALERFPSVQLGTAMLANNLFSLSLCALDRQFLQRGENYFSDVELDVTVEAMSAAIGSLDEVARREGLSIGQRRQSSHLYKVSRKGSRASDDRRLRNSLCQPSAARFLKACQEATRDAAAEGASPPGDQNFVESEELKIRVELARSLEHSGQCALAGAGLKHSLAVKAITLADAATYKERLLAGSEQAGSEQAERSTSRALRQMTRDTMSVDAIRRVEDLLPQSEASGAAKFRADVARALHPGDRGRTFVLLAGGAKDLLQGAIAQREAPFVSTVDTSCTGSAPSARGAATPSQGPSTTQPAVSPESPTASPNTSEHDSDSRLSDDDCEDERPGVVGRHGGKTMRSDRAWWAEPTTAMMMGKTMRKKMRTCWASFSATRLVNLIALA